MPILWDLVGVVAVGITIASAVFWDGCNNRDFMDARFNALDERLSAIEPRLGAAETRLGDINSKLSAIEARQEILARSGQ